MYNSESAKKAEEILSKYDDQMKDALYRAL